MFLVCALESYHVNHVNSNVQKARVNVSTKSRAEIQTMKQIEHSGVGEILEIEQRKNQSPSKKLAKGRVSNRLMELFAVQFQQ